MEDHGAKFKLVEAFVKGPSFFSLVVEVLSRLMERTWDVRLLKDL